MVEEIDTHVHTHTHTLTPISQCLRQPLNDRKFGFKLPLSLGTVVRVLRGSGFQKQENDGGIYRERGR